MAIWHATCSTVLSRRMSTPPSHAVSSAGWEPFAPVMSAAGPVRMPASQVAGPRRPGVVGRTRRSVLTAPARQRHGDVEQLQRLAESADLPTCYVAGRPLDAPLVVRGVLCQSLVFRAVPPIDAARRVSTEQTANRFHPGNGSGILLPVISISYAFEASTSDPAASVRCS